MTSTPNALSSRQAGDARGLCKGRAHACPANTDAHSRADTSTVLPPPDGAQLPRSSQAAVGGFSQTQVFK